MREKEELVQEVPHVWAYYVRESVYDSRIREWFENTPAVIHLATAIVRLREGCISLYDLTVAWDQCSHTWRACAPSYWRDLMARAARATDKRAEGEDKPVMLRKADLALRAKGELVLLTKVDLIPHHLDVDPEALIEALLRA